MRSYEGGWTGWVTSRITILEGKYNYLLNSPEKSGVFRESMGFDRAGLDSALRTHLISNFGTATPDGPMTGGGKKFNVRVMMTGRDQAARLGTSLRRGASTPMERYG